MFPPKKSGYVSKDSLSLKNQNNIYKTNRTSHAFSAKGHHYEKKVKTKMELSKYVIG